MELLPPVEVVVCTRNRARLLAAACEAILGQDYPAELWRLLIVDNLSTDDTFDVARSLEARFPGRVHAKRNDELGQCAARNAGVAATRADIIAFTDDDALPDRTWLRSLVEAMLQEEGQVTGGPVDLQLSGELPPWFILEFMPYLAVWHPATEVTRLTFNNYPRGVNMAIRREVFDRCGPFSRHLGLRGKRQLFCDESELCLRVERHGGAIVYTPASRVRHCVEARRFTAAWLASRFRAQGRSEARLDWMHGGLRGLWRGSRVHRANLWATPVAAVAQRGVGPDGAPVPCQEPRQAARLATSFRHRALAAYMLEIPVAIATVPRYRAPSGERLPPWVPV